MLPLSSLDVLDFSALEWACSSSLPTTAFAFIMSERAVICFLAALPRAALWMRRAAAPSSVFIDGSSSPSEGVELEFSSVTDREETCEVYSEVAVELGGRGPSSPELTAASGCSAGATPSCENTKGGQMGVCSSVEDGGVCSDGHAQCHPPAPCHPHSCDQLHHHGFI